MIGPAIRAVRLHLTVETDSAIGPIALARGRGAASVATTNHAAPRLGQVAEIVRAPTAQGSLLTGENAAGRIARLNVLDALSVALARRNAAATDACLQRTMAAAAPQGRQRGR